MLPNLLASFDELGQAFANIARNSIGKNRVWAIAELGNRSSGNKRFWVTISTQNTLQVIGNELKSRLDEANARSKPIGPMTKPEASSFNAVRRTINEKIADYVGRQGMGGDDDGGVGHAEERVIMGWDEMIKQYGTHFNREEPDEVRLYLSDSPCTIHDGPKASDNLPGKPKSCYAKLELLVTQKPEIKSWTIYYRKKWGMLEQKKAAKNQTPAAWSEVQQRQAMVNDNPRYQLFTEELEKLANDANLKRGG
ncbi:hypothetical protein [Burkholderia gladioli]|uniref:hypothetical protein n=1 Tax=Burkholderia gladioli TaxID=28095 RepID=UPI000F5214E2|nr:hypothetical protein [Burkholderia gladioli]